MGHRQVVAGDLNNALEARTGTEPRTMSHHRMVRHWRLGLADPVSPQIIAYVHYDGVWWSRRRTTWTAIPDGPFALSLSAGRARLAGAARAAGVEPAPRDRDPWAAARNRLRMGVACGKAPTPWPMRATDLRPCPPTICRQRPPSD